MEKIKKTIKNIGTIFDTLTGIVPIIFIAYCWRGLHPELLTPEPSYSIEGEIIKRGEDWGSYNHDPNQEHFFLMNIDTIQDLGSYPRKVNKTATIIYDDWRKVNLPGTYHFWDGNILMKSDGYWVKDRSSLWVGNVPSLETVMNDDAITSFTVDVTKYPHEVRF